MCLRVHTHTHRGTKISQIILLLLCAWYFLWYQFYSSSYKWQNDGHGAQNWFPDPFVVPAFYGAIFYYIIMGAISVIGAAIPYAVGVLLILYSLFFYKMAKHLFSRRWRVPLLIVWTAISVLVLLIFASPSSSITNFWDEAGLDTSNWHKHVYS